MNNEEQFWDWLKIGMDNGWVSRPFCNTHDGGMEYATESEIEQWEEGNDPCQTVLRVLGVDE